ncbi:MAG: hypothetical protein ACO2ZP_00605 [Bacteriovoracaceae bacterium]
MKFICKKECFYKDRVWGVGETLLLSDSEKEENIPEHFVKNAIVEEVIEEPEPKMTLSEVGKSSPKSFSEAMAHIKKVKNKAKPKVKEDKGQKA